VERVSKEEANELAELFVLRLNAEKPFHDDYEYGIASQIEFLEFWYFDF
jgi:hypothetical protein